MRRSAHSAVLATVVAAGAVIAPVTTALPAYAAASLSITPIEWNVVGLDSNTPASGPHRFVIGADVCNTGTEALTDVTTTWVWDTASTAMSLIGPAVKDPFALAVGECNKVWYSIDVVAAASSFDQTRRFHIDAAATGATTVSTPVPREIYVERLVSQNRNAINSITGPDTVYVGGTYTYVLDASTATNGYEQLSATPFLDPSIFEIQSVTKVMDVGGTDDTFYTDACGWVNDPTDTITPAYRECAATGKAGGDLTVTVVASVIGTGSGAIQAVIYDFSGSSYHYNSDFGDPIKSLPFVALAAPTGPTAVDDNASTSEDTATPVTVLTNDTDPDNDIDPTTVRVTGDPTNGTTSVNPVTGVITYTPNPNWSGTDTFTYEVCDATELCDTATVTVLVGPVNDAPVAVNDSQTVAQGAPATVVPVLTNDSDVDRDTLTATSVTQPTNGTVTLVNGVVSYQPNPTFSGTDPFTYTISDGEGGTATATVTITVTPTTVPPTTPTAVDDNASTSEDTATPVTVLTNDTDPDNDIDPTTVRVTGDPTNGTTSVNPVTGVITYTPNPNWSGTDTFTYEVCDATELCDTATVTVLVGPVNDAPVAVNDSQTVAQGAPATVVPVLTNDSDVDRDTLTATSVTQPTNGTVTLVNGVVSYQPNPTFSGTDPFTYTISDGEGGTATATVTITVTPTTVPPTTPTAVDDNASTSEDTATPVTVLTNDTDPDNDIDPTTVRVTGDPTNGTTSVNPVTGVITYTPNPNWSGTDTFTYEVCDATELCDTATVTVLVGPVNDAPVAVNDSQTVAQGAPATVVPVLTNDSDVDRDTLTATSVTQPTNGTVTLVNGVVSYQPNPTFSGTDPFTYTISDGEGGTATATVTITVTPIANTNPVAVNDSQTVAQGAPATVVPVLTNDSDVDRDTLTATSVTQPTNGTVTLVNGVVSYQPNPTFSGTDPFTYTISDGEGGTATATVTMTVTPRLVLVDDVATVPAGGSVTIRPTQNDTAVPAGSVLTVPVAPNHGTVRVNPDGTLTYTPATGYSGPDQFTYRVCTPVGVCSTAVVRVTVTAAPVAAPARRALARTGTSLELLFGAGLLLTLGGVMTVAGRRPQNR